MTAPAGPWWLQAFVLAVLIGAVVATSHLGGQLRRESWQRPTRRESGCGTEKPQTR